MQILLDSGRWNKGNKARHPEYFIYHLQAGPYLNASFWPYCGLLQSNTQASAHPWWGYRAALCEVIFIWIQVKNLK